jgi:RNA-splicing ligase RtcB
MSRSKAKATLSMDDYTASMNGIYTSSVSQSTLDECPMAYKPMDEILSNITDAVHVANVIKPVYNFKAGE